MTPRAPQSSARSEVPVESTVMAAHAALAGRKAVDLVLLDMREVTLVTDYFLICHGTSDVHIRGLADAVREALKEDDLRPMAVEWDRQGGWTLLDYGDFIVHIFSDEQRQFYDLERLWSDARFVPVAEETES